MSIMNVGGPSLLMPSDGIYFTTTSQCTITGFRSWLNNITSNFSFPSTKQKQYQNHMSRHKHMASNGQSGYLSTVLLKYCRPTVTILVMYRIGRKTLIQQWYGNIELITKISGFKGTHSLLRPFSVYNPDQPGCRTDHLLGEFEFILKNFLFCTEQF